MAITTSYANVQSQFIPQYWDSIEEFEEYYLQRLKETQADTNYYTNKNGIEEVLPPIDHHPELKEYEVWISGYAATGEYAQASLMGKAFARNFADACDIVECKSHLEWLEKVNSPDYKEYYRPSKWSYDPHKLTDWASGLYWNEKDARRSFG